MAAAPLRNRALIASAAASTTGFRKGSTTRSGRCSIPLACGFRATDGIGNVPDPTPRSRRPYQGCEGGPYLGLNLSAYGRINPLRQRDSAATIRW